MTPTVSLRTASAEDTPAIAELWTEVYVNGGLVPRAAPFTSADVTRARDGGELLIAERNAAIVGAVALVAHGAPLANLVRDEAERQVCLLAVSATVRRGGVGRRLMVWCIDTARARHARSLLLWTRPTQGNAHRLYEELGFVRIPERDDSAPAGHPRLAYRLAL